MSIFSVISFFHILIVFNKVKLLTLSTNLPCSKYFVDGIGQNTISVEKFNLDFYFKFPKLKSSKLFNTAICLVGRLDSQSMKYFLHNIQRSANIEFFREEPNSVIVQGKIHKYSTENIGKFFSSNLYWVRSGTFLFCYIIHEMAIQVDICYFCLCCFYIVPQDKFWKQTEDKKLRSFDQRVVPRPLIVQSSKVVEITCHRRM